MAITLTPSTYNGHNINDGTIYKAAFRLAGRGLEAWGNWPTQIVETERTGQTPQFVRHQPQSRDYTLIIHIPSAQNTLTNVNTLKSWFQPSNTAADLVLSDGTNTIRIPCVPVECVPEQTNPDGVWRVVLRATSPAEANSATTDSNEIIANGETSVLTNAGSDKAYPTFTITPNTVMADTNSWIKRRRLVVANRSEMPWTDPIGDGWPVDVAEDAWDTATLQAAGKVLNTLNDVRPILEGAEQYRWLDPSTANATSKLWVNLQMRARKTATLAANIDAVVLTLTASNAEGFFGWPQAGFCVIDSECIQYTARTLTTLTTVRATRNTTAAVHSAGATLYWVEHPFFDIIYDYANAADPAPPDDRKPVIDLATSTNDLFKWTGPFINATDRRSAAWQPLRSDNGFTSDYITLFESGGALRFQDIAPSVSKPNFNNIYLDDPAGVSTASAGISIDEIIQANLRLNIYAIDLGGNEVMVASWDPDQNAVVAANTETLSNVAFRIRLNARNGVLTGSWAAVNASTLAISALITTLDSMSFVCDHDDAKVTGLAIRKADGTVYIRMANGTTQPHLGILEGGQRYHVAYYNNAGTVVFHLMPDDGGVPGAFNTENLDTADGVSVAGLANLGGDALTAARHYWVYAGDLTLRGLIPSIRVLTDGLTDAQDDAPVKTEEYIELDNIVLKRDTTRTPKIVMAAEEVCYLMNLRLKNDTTGDYLDIFYPMKLGQNIVINCEDKRVTDGETGVDIPFVCSPSNPAEWIYLQPGANTISYNETGVVSTTLAWSFRSKF